MKPYLFITLVTSLGFSINADTLRKLDSVSAIERRPVVGDTTQRNTAIVYQITSGKLNRELLTRIVENYKININNNCDSLQTPTSWSDNSGVTAAYFPQKSMITFFNSRSAKLNKEEIIPDTLIKGKTDPILKNFLRENFNNYQFVNFETQFIQRRNAANQDSVDKPVPTFYTGRYLRKLDGRLILGDVFQANVTVGSRGLLKSLEYREPMLVAQNKVSVPTKAFVLDSIRKWQESKTHSRPSEYPNHPAHLKILAIKPIKVFESYLVENQKGGQSLVPSITVFAEVKLSKVKEKSSFPQPPEPTYLHFHFPCRPASGLCWPDGIQATK